MMDYWLIVALAVPFAEVILHTIMDNLRVNIEKEDLGPRKELIVNGVKINNFMKSKNDIQLKLIQKFTTYGLPLIFLAFLITYFLAGAYIVYYIEDTKVLTI